MATAIEGTTAIGSTGDAAKRLDVTPAWVLRGLVAAGILAPVARTVGGIFLFRMADVERVRDQRRAQRRRRKRMPVVMSS